jgi:HEAT repeat protein/type II secretory pathway predicted ATPase ExeA
MSQMVPLSVFISYARSDGLEAATRLLNELTRSQIGAWLDGRNLDPFHDFTAEIEDAIERASHVAVCITQGSKRDDSFVRREIAYATILRKPIVPLRFAEVPPHIQIATLPFIDLFRDWESGLAEFLRRLGRPPQDQEFAIPAFDPFRPHLERLNGYILDELRRTLLHPEGVVQLRTSGVGRAQFRALPVAYRSSRPSWFWAGEQGEQEFASFPEAFEHHRRRVVLLGEPGAGKTTTLLAFAREAVSRRLADPGALLPVYVPIRTWDGESDLVAWIAAAAGLDSETLRAAVVSGQALLLLDGLDELRRISLRPDASEDPRLVFLRATTKLGERPDASADPRLAFLQATTKLGRTPMVITCRRAEYERMAASPTTRVELEAVVRLLPLTDEQIGQYLVKGRHLLAALRSDDALRGMARNPLILTLLAMAYRDEDFQPDGLKNSVYGPVGFRNRILSSFVAQRYEFEAARFGKGIKPPFTLDEVYEGLGAGAMDLLDQFGLEESVAVVLDLDGHSRDPVDLVEADVRSFRRRLGPAALPFLAFTARLNLIVPARRGSVRFAHLLIRDHFAFAEASKRLREGDPAVRRSAVGVLGLIGDRRALPQLFHALEDPDDTVQALVVWALGEIGDPAAMEPLLAAIRGIERSRLVGSTPSIAIEALGKLGDRAVEPLRQLLKDEGRVVRQTGWLLPPFAPSYEVRQAAARALGRIGAAAVPTLIDALKDENVREEAIAALGASRDPAAFDPLISAAGSLFAAEAAFTAEQGPAVGSGWPAWQLVRALGSLGDPRAIPILMAFKGTYQDEALDAIASIGGPEAVHGLLAVLRDREPERRSQAALCLGKLGGAEVTTQLEAALDDPDLRVRVAAATSLERLGFDLATLRARRPSTAELLTALDHADPDTRAMAARQLGQRHDPRVADALAGAMADENNRVAWMAQEALASLGDSRAVEPLGESLFTFTFGSMSFFRAVASFMGSLASPELVPYVRAFLGFEAINENAVEALGKVPDAEAAWLLIDALDDEDARAHPSVISALVAIGEAAVPPLLEVLREPDPRFRSILESILASIGAPAAPRLLHLLRSEDPLMEVAARILGRIGAAAVPALLDALSDPSPIVQALAAGALGATDDDRAARPLVSLLGHADENVRIIAAKALVKLGESAVMPLIEALHSASPTTRAKAATTLGEIGAGEAVRPLLRALTDPEPLVRRNAITSLPQLREPGIEPTMRPLLDDAHLGVRLAALKALEGTVDEDFLARRQPSVEELLTALDDPDPQLRADAIPWLALTVQDGPSIGAVRQEPLTRALADADLTVQISAARQLALLGLVDPLFDGLQAQDESTRTACATALAATEEAVSEPLRLLLRHDQPATRRAAARILGARHDGDAVPGLIALLLDKDIDVQQEATTALVAMPEHSKEMLLQLIAVDRLGPPVREAVRRMGEATVQPLIQLLATEDERVRAHAVAILVAIGRPAVKPLITALDPDEGDAKAFRVGAAEALNAIGHRRGLAALNAVLRDEHGERWLAAAHILGIVFRTFLRLDWALRSGRALVRRITHLG